MQALPTCPECAGGVLTSHSPAPPESAGRYCTALQMLNKKRKKGKKRIRILSSLSQLLLTTANELTERERQNERQ